MKHLQYICYHKIMFFTLLIMLNKIDDDKCSNLLTTVYINNYQTFMKRNRLQTMQKHYIKCNTLKTLNHFSELFDREVSRWKKR